MHAIVANQDSQANVQQHHPFISKICSRLAGALLDCPRHNESDKPRRLLTCLLHVFHEICMLIGCKMALRDDQPSVC